MIPLESLSDAEANSYAAAQTLLDNIRRIVAVTPNDVEEALEQLQIIRRDAYEDLNQVQHEYLILRGARWLIEQDVVCVNVSWSWNPRQTGHANEPDLAATLNDQTLASAEATTSPEPKGKIDERMATTLRSLSAMPGERFYFVRSESMHRRATTKIEKAGWDIRAVCIE